MDDRARKDNNASMGEAGDFYRAFCSCVSSQRRLQFQQDESGEMVWGDGRRIGCGLVLLGTE